MGSGTIAAVRGIETTTNRFRSLLLDIADRLSVNADWIAAVMASESGFNPAARNPSGGATGLIQFMPSTARRLGTTTDDLASMSAEEQLTFVEKYYAPFAGRMHSPEDVYMATFMPVHVGKPSDNVIATEGDGSHVYEQNKGFDHNHDGTITNGEVGATVRNILAAAATRPRIDVTDEGGSGADDPLPPSYY